MLSRFPVTPNLYARPAKPLNEADAQVRAEWKRLRPYAPNPEAPWEPAGEPTRGALAAPLTDQGISQWTARAVVRPAQPTSALQLADEARFRAGPIFTRTPDDPRYKVTVRMNSIDQSGMALAARGAAFRDVPVPVAVTRSLESGVREGGPSMGGLLRTLG